MAKSKSNAAVFGLAALTMSLLWTGCELPNGGDNGNRDAVPNIGPVAILQVAYQQDPAAFLITFDKDIPGLTAEDIETVSQNPRNLTWTKGTLSGPDANHTYTLPVIFKSIKQDGDAVVAVAKRGYQIGGGPKTVPVALIEDYTLLSLGAYPDAASGLPVEKLILTFNQPVPGLSVDNILMYHNLKLDKRNGQWEDKGNGVYEMGVINTEESYSGHMALAPVKSGYRFWDNMTPRRALGGGTGNNSIDITIRVAVNFRFAKVNEVLLRASQTNIPGSSPSAIISLDAKVYKEGVASDQVDFTLGKPVAGVTLTPNPDGKSATLMVSPSVNVGSILVSAAAKDKPSRNSQTEITVDKFASVVTTDQQFLNAFTGSGDLIIIPENTRVQSPRISQDILGHASPKTIEIRNGATLVVRDSNDNVGLFIKGSIRVRNGGALVLNGFLVNAYKGGNGGDVRFGNDEVIFPGSYDVPTASSFNGPANGTTFNGATHGKINAPIKLSFNNRQITLSREPVEPCPEIYPRTIRTLNDPNVEIDLNITDNLSKRIKMPAGYTLVRDKVKPTWTTGGTGIDAYPYMGFDYE